MKLEGQIYLDGLDGVKNKILVDAEPHIMSRLRKIFDNAHDWFNQGKYTHRPIIFPMTLHACRDVVWLLERYNFEISKELHDAIQAKADEYDQILINVANLSKNSVLNISPEALKMAITLRKTQVEFKNMSDSVKKLLNADVMGVGKSFAGLATFLEPERRPGLIVVPPTLCTQWKEVINQMYPDATTHTINGFKNYELPVVDFLITSYNRLGPWQDVLMAPTTAIKTLLMDEIQELRKLGTQKRDMCKLLAKKAEVVTGLSGTPIYNYGEEIWSVLDAIKDGCLGDLEDFKEEWCINGRVYEPAILNAFLINQGLMIRRTPEEAGLDIKKPSKQIIKIDADIEKLKEVQDVMKLLALSVLSGNVGEDSESAKQFDWKLRMATGIAKARPVCEFVKMLCENGEKVLLTAWHRDVYDIYLKELAEFNPVMYTGSESPAQKDKSKKEFIEGNAQILITSLRSTAGMDGLQYVCNTAVFGELDWSPHVMDQVLFRLTRFGQIKHVNAYFPVVADGSDPYMIGINSEKRSQHEGVIEGKEAEAGLLEATPGGMERVREMAAAYLRSQGVEVPEPVVETGLLAEAAGLIRRLKLPNNSEAEMQIALDKVLRSNLSSDVKIEREAKITKRSRLDFLIERGSERIAIECKIESGKKAEVYRQVRRYVEEGQITCLILVAPWFGIPAFKVDGIPVVIIDPNLNSI